MKHLAAGVSLCILSLAFCNGICGKTPRLRPFNMEIKGSATASLNMASSLDAPAGRDGFICVRNGHLAKPDGERFRIWGVNLASGANFPEKANAEAMADYMARLGVNAVRFHFMDIDSPTGRGLFHNGEDNTRVLSAVELDKVDYLIYQLKQRGIYSDINLNTGRTYREGDGVDNPRGIGLAKGATLYDDHLIELQKEYARSLLTHVNPYTGNAYFEEPAVICVEIVNENSLCESWFNARLLGKRTEAPGHTWYDVTPYYGKVLDRKYNSWLKENISPEQLALLEKEAGIGSGCDIPRLEPEQFTSASHLRFHTEARFIMETERNFYTEMYKYLKDELHVQQPVIANSDHNHYKWGYSLLSSLALMDCVDGHVYWHDYENFLGDEPGKERWGRKDNLPMVSVPEIATVTRLSRSAVEGLPFTISELNNGSYNDWFCEGIPIVGTYGALQDWDGFYFFTLAHKEPELWDSLKSGGLDLVWDPVRLANFTATGLAFRRGDFKPSQNTFGRGYSPETQREGMRNPGGTMPFFTPDFNNLTPLVSKTRVISFAEDSVTSPKFVDRRHIESDTGELLWCADDDRSIVSTCTPRTESVIGFMSEAQGRLKHMDVDVRNGFAAVTLTSLDGDDLSVSRKMLLVATARARIMGKRPTMIEVVDGTISLSGLEGASRLNVEPLDGAGNPLRSYSVPVIGGKASIKTGKDVTVWYMITVD